jgi:hypothetical protein
MWGVWLKDKKDWLRERADVCCSSNAILAFTSKRAACSRAAKEYGFASYTEAKRKDWVEVRPLPTVKA